MPPKTETEKTLVDKPLSFSQMSTFLQCRYRWYLQYVLGIRPQVRGAALEIGDAVHRGLAAFLAGGDVVDGLTEWWEEIQRNIPVDDDKINEKVNEMALTAQAITERAMRGLEELGYWTANHPKTGKPMVEHEFVVPVLGWKGGMIVKLDWMAFDPVNNRLWVVDFKTRGYFTTEDDEWANLQNAMYQAAALHHGVDTVGTLTFQISSTPPKKPKLNKAKGDAPAEMSRADIACDWSGYVAALEENGLDPENYQDMRAKLENKEFVRVTTVIRPVEQIERVWNDVVEPIAQSMAASLSHWRRYKEITERTALHRNLSPRSCNYCGQRPVCHGDLKGYDVLPIIQRDFDVNAAGLERFGPKAQPSETAEQATATA